MTFASLTLKSSARYINRGAQEKVTDAFDLLEVAHCELEQLLVRICLHEEVLAVVFVVIKLHGIALEDVSEE